jgi:hypothetical protein
MVMEKVALFNVVEEPNAHLRVYCAHLFSGAKCSGKLRGAG